MSKSTMEIQGDLSSGMTSLIKLFPSETKKFMKKKARELRNQAKKKARSTVNKESGDYLKGFAAGKKVYEWSDAEYNIRVYNRAPHAHLIELGHEMIGHEPDKKKLREKVDGFEIINKTMEEWDSQFNSSVENELLDFIAKELEK